MDPPHLARKLFRTTRIQFFDTTGSMNVRSREANLCFICQNCAIDTDIGWRVLI